MPALQRLQNAAAASHVCFVAFSNHSNHENLYDVCGLLFISTETRRSYRSRSKSVESGFLHTFGVAHSFQGGGVGKSFYTALEWWDHTHTKKLLSLTVKEGLDIKNEPSYEINNQRAKRLQNLYTKRGFVVIECDPVLEGYTCMKRIGQPELPFPPLYKVADS